MIRTSALALIAAAGFAVPAFAAEVEPDSAGVSAAIASDFAFASATRQATLVLAKQGYVNVAITGRDDDGRYTGTAFKDGNTLLVAVDLPKPHAATTN